MARWDPSYLVTPPPHGANDPPVQDGQIRDDPHPYAHQKVTQSRHPPGVDTEPRDDDVENAAWADEPARSTAQRQFSDATGRGSNRTFEALK